MIDPTKVTDTVAPCEQPLDVRDDTVWLTAVEAAEELGVTIRDVFDLIESGAVDARRAGRTMLVASSQLARMASLLGRA